ncbi:MBL fold metallo-hydrolase [Bombilactobacillus bombi]|uniref:MBL fold metallo-hydrolase n=1 Tax=Bombilactobacillus bombi TaxID=1303590 RepID=A0A3R6W9Q2_9LACO|nr:MBL fold metallo-hydrolase [Bombilactobacillus bombi]RHW50185.1 MBL fold metallo-hydrolase [Bombilactobacillus bombi]
MKLTVLGYYGGYPYRGQATSGYLVQEQGFNLLLDCGSGVLNSLMTVIDPLQLDAVLLTHYHHDHMADLGVLQYYWQLKTGKKKHPQLTIYGHTQDPLNFASLTMPNVSQGLAYSELQSLDLGPFTITFLKTIHPVPAFATKIVSKKDNKIFVFTSDTAYFEGLIEFSQQADLLVTDTNFGAAKKGQIWHMTSQQSGKLAQDAHVQRLVISHLPQEYSLDKLQRETQQAAGDIAVIRARTGLKIVF